MGKSSTSSILTVTKKTVSEFKGLFRRMPLQFRSRLMDLQKKIQRLEADKRIGGERPMKCICRKKFKGFSTWYPHWKSRHPVLHKRYSAVKGKKGQAARGNLMLRMMRAASA